MAFTQVNLDAVEAAISSGELKVMFDGREVWYRSVADLLRARDTIKASLQSAGTLPAATRTSYASRSRT
ncbi:MAG: hypothetical protein A2503_16780 [Burkholderiales bacterium RIFOXYD12_FULL_59_19]|nr:MAG: hypothetical protein A2503_16780 [Burkholderiales bacterium RIFOXYD12_FULL_59_19]